MLLCLNSGTLVKAGEGFYLYFFLFSYPVSLCASSTPTRVVPCVSNAVSTFEYFKSKVFIFPTPYSYIHEKAKSIFRSGERGKKKRFLKLSSFEYWQETFQCQTWKTTCRYVHLHILSNEAQFSVSTRGKYSYFFLVFRGSKCSSGCLLSFYFC